jgi:RNA-directed DNA polymerase
MTKAPISLQDLRRSLYVKAKAELSWRFWGLYVHGCKMETLRDAYQMARSNGGAPGIDGVTFAGKSTNVQYCFWQVFLVHFGSLIWPTLSY